MATMVMNQDRNIVYPLNLFKLRARAHFVVSPNTGDTILMGWKIWMDISNGTSSRIEGCRTTIEVPSIDLGDFDTEEEANVEIARIRDCVTKGEQLIKISGYYVCD